MQLTFRMKLFSGFLGISLLLAAIVLGLVYRRVRTLPAEITQSLLLATTAGQRERFDPVTLSAGRDALETALETARTHEPNVAFSQSAAHAGLLNHPAIQSLQASMLAIDEDPPHFGTMRPFRPAERLVGPKGYEKNVYLVVPANAGKTVGHILAAMRTEDIGSTIDIASRPVMQNSWLGPHAQAEITEDEAGQAMGGWAPICDGDGTPLALLGIEAPAKDIQDLEWEIVAISLGIFLTAGLVSILPAWWLSRRIYRPVAKLNAGMQKVREGDIDARIEPVPQTGDEFETLIRTFNDMTDGLVERNMLRDSLQLAKGIQQNLLPPEASLSFGAFDIYGAIQYCDETGGDYFDYIEPEGQPQQLGIAIGDITGHGIGAALLMASGRALLRSHATPPPDDLGDLFEDINAHFVRDTDHMRFMTLFYGVLDTQVSPNTLAYASAGHDPALLFRANGTIESLPNTGIPLGILEETTFEQVGPMALHPGDLLVLSTDGVREAMNVDGDMFGEERFIAVIEANRDKSAHEIHDAVVQAVLEFQDYPRDDVTLIIIQHQNED